MYINNSQQQINYYKIIFQKLFLYYNNTHNYVCYLYKHITINFSLIIDYSYSFYKIQIITYMIHINPHNFRHILFKVTNSPQQLLNL